MEMLGKDSKIFKVFTTVRDSNAALFPLELFEILPDLKEHSIRYCLCKLVEEKLNQN